MRIIASIAVAILLVSVCSGNEEVVEYARVRNAPELAGTILDAAGTPIPEVNVSVMSDDWNKEVRSTKTDQHGQWSLTPAEKGKTYKVQCRGYGLKSVRIRVKVTDHRAKPLFINMPNA